MSLIINHNLMAQNATRNLGKTYSQLSTSVERLSSGLRINSAADDAAGLAIRELMRSDIATTNQGLRNAADAISLIQTADGALGVIDEKLTRMKELAELAATVTYTPVQRDIITSEYQAMAREIDRIAAATNFNGVKLLDGSISTQHGGQGLKVHFGVGNNAAEDYYFINIGDVRATSSGGLRVGGDAKNDIWGQGGAASIIGDNKGPGCCGAGFSSLNDPDAKLASGASFSYGYNWDWKEGDETKLVGGKYTAGLYRVGSGASLQNLVDMVNAGTQSRVGLKFEVTAGSDLYTNASAFSICLGDEAYFWSTAAGSAVAHAEYDAGKSVVKKVGDGDISKALTSAINTNSNSFWAMWDSANSTVYVFNKEGGDHNDLLACEQLFKGTATTSSEAKALLGNVSFENVATGRNDKTTSAGTNFSLGGERWATMTPIMTQNNNGTEVWNVTLNGRDVGDGRNLWIANIGSGASYDLDVTKAGGTANYTLTGLVGTAANITGMGRDSFVEIQNAADGQWKGAEVRTQSSAQEALEALTEAITRKDKVRADLGAMQNRLENTISNLEIQSENLQAAESRISDVDVAKEMTEFTKNNVLTQAAVGMLAQANSLSSLALALLG
ncbi:MAG: flagellin [Candidatus Adiutrix sp.]|jgi:flagellin|nr:flagellin [Candidatus Adiutrix sp.]